MPHYIIQNQLKILTGVVPGALAIVWDAVLVATVAGLISHEGEA